MGNWLNKLEICVRITAVGDHPVDSPLCSHSCGDHTLAAKRSTKVRDAPYTSWNTCILDVQGLMHAWRLHRMMQAMQFAWPSLTSPCLEQSDFLQASACLHI